MSLQDLNEAIEGLWDGGVAASGSALVSSSDQHEYVSERVDLVVHAVAIDKHTAVSLQRWCGPHKVQDSTPILPFSRLLRGGPLVRASAKLDALAFVVSKDWMPPTWFCVASLEDILTASATDDRASSTPIADKTNQLPADGVHMTGPPLEWRAFFATLLRLVNSCAVRVQNVDDKKGTAVLNIPDLRCQIPLRRMWGEEDAQKLVLWSSSHLARALSFRAETVATLERSVASATRQLELVTAELTSLARECGRTPLTVGQATLAGEPDQEKREASAIAPPTNLVNPQVRPGMKRGRGMRIQ